jgi:hypothetical protein
MDGWLCVIDMSACSVLRNGSAFFPATVADRMWVSVCGCVGVWVCAERRQ